MKMKSLLPLVLLPLSIAAELPEFSLVGALKTSDGELIRANSMCASPAPVDWDGDGDIDLLMGEFGPNVWPSEAGIRLFINSAGPGKEPVLSGGELLEAGGSPIALSAGWCIGASNPQVVDINGDGYRDIIVGEENGEINFFAGTAGGGLASGEKMKADGSTMKIGNNSSPLLTDWDNDGDLDLLVGQKGPSEYSSDIKIFINDGTVDAPAFKAAGALQVNGISTVQRFYRGQLDIHDLDRDGLEDLLVANANGGVNSGNVCFVKNVGTKSEPAFDEVTLLQADGSDISMLTQQQYASKKDARVRVTDWNADGVPDLLVACDNIFLYHGSGTVATKENIMVEPAKQIEIKQIDKGLRLYSKNQLDDVSLKVFTLQGQRVIHEEVEVDGEAVVELPVKVAPGLYFMSLETADFTETMRLLIE